MFSKDKAFTNWGKNIYINPKRITPKNYDELKKIINKKSFIVHGNQRSYGDVALNKDLVVSMKNFNQIKFFNEKKGIIEIESGLLLSDLLPVITAKGWFPPLPFIDNYRSLIHVDDLVRALWLVASDGRARNQIYIATDGKSYSSREIYESICHSLSKPIPKWYIPYFIFLIPSLFSSSLRHKTKKLFEDSNYSSKKLESLGFKAEHSFGE